MAAKIGQECKLYRNTGSAGSPTWDEVPEVGDLTLSMSKDKGDASTRGSRYRRYKGGMKDLGVSFNLLWDGNGSADLQIFLDAYTGDTQVEIAVADGAIASAGTEYARFIGEVFNFNRVENLGDPVKAEIDMAPSYDSTTAPTWNTAA